MYRPNETHHDSGDEDDGPHHRKDHVDVVPLGLLSCRLRPFRFLRTGWVLDVKRGLLRREDSLDELLRLYGWSARGFFFSFFCVDSPFHMQC
jgi:hypothetical protein